MPTEAFVLDRPGPSARLTTVFEDLHRLHLPSGRSYVVLARGQLFARQVVLIDLRLEAFDAVEEIRFQNLEHSTPATGTGAGLADPLADFPQDTFSLAVTTTLPGDDEDLFVNARLSGRASFVGDGVADIRKVKIIALTVDSLSVNPA